MLFIDVEILSKTNIDFVRKILGKRNMD